MASTTRPTRPSGATPGGPVRPPAPPVRRQRRWSLALVSVLVALGSALAFALLWANAGDRRPVLAVSRTVPAGQVIEADDLTVVRVAADAGIRPVPAERRQEVVGATAAADLLPGTLLTDAHLGDESLIGESEAVVGVAVEGGQLPVANLGRGDRVRVVLTAPAGSPAEAPGGARGGAPASLGQVVAEGRVFEVEQLADASGTVVVSLVVDEELAPTIAGASAAKRVSLVLVPAR
ncbi:MAG: hypothetical protein KY447_10715 [Actinobacteria bacterium]|nr:hypothetical protein [Actinomycetota bacterium]